MSTTPLPPPSNPYLNECSIIAKNIRKCVFAPSATETHTFQFQSKTPSFLLLNMHCENEMRSIHREMQQKGIAFQYKLVYDTQIPYNITFNKNELKTSVSQRPFM